MTVPDDVRERIAGDPFCRTLGIDLEALEPGRSVATLRVREELLNFHGTPHGGAVNALADAAFAAASNSRGETAVALETNVSYLAAADVGDLLRAEATETHRSRRTVEYAVVVTVGDDGEGGEGATGAGAGDDTDATRAPAVGDRIATFRGRVYRP